MKSLAKQQRKARWMEEFEEAAEILAARDFVIRQYSDTHFRIKYQNNPNEVDVWPTTQRYYVRGTDNKGTYRGMDALIDLVRDIFEV